MNLHTNTRNVRDAGDPDREFGGLYQSS
jgi:hypothetical protein